MKKYILVLLAVIMLMIVGCTHELTPPQDTVVIPSQTQPITGWKEEDGKKYYYTEGAPHIGWLQLDGKTYFLGMDGALRSGWIESDGKIYYLDPEAGGAAYTGWLEAEGERYYFGTDGIMKTGWLELQGQRYYLGADGAMHTGWLEQGSDLYYMKPDGTMTRGKQEIDGKTRYFTASGTHILLVNPWNYMPADYSPTIVSLGNGHSVNKVCYEDLMQMLSDCRTAGLDPQVASSYRTWEHQVYLFNRKVDFYLQQGYDEETAKTLAGTVIAIPGTSEHQLGLALDLVDNSNWNLDESQEKTPAQQWLMKNSWKYGFILRYPNNKSHVTGIIYEPWHYRYVGRETAKQVYESGLCLEEYLEGLQ